MGNKSQISVGLVTNFDYLHNFEYIGPALEGRLPNVEITLVAINIPPRWKKFLLCEFPRTNFIFEDLNFESDEQERGYCTNRRVRLLKQLLNGSGFSQLVCYLDINTVLTDDFNLMLEEFFDSEESVGVCIDSDHYMLKMPNWPFIAYPTGPLGTRYFGVALGGVQLYRVTQQSLQFLELMDSLVSQQLTSWYADQEAVFLALTKLGYIESGQYFNCISYVDFNGDLDKENSSGPIAVLCKKGGRGSNIYFQERNRQLSGGLNFLVRALMPPVSVRFKGYSVGGILYRVLVKVEKFFEKVF